jgi:hypothetical protein
MRYRSDAELFPVWHERRSIWERSGLGRRQQKVLDLSLVGLLLLFTAGWVYAAVSAFNRGEMPVVARQIATAASPLSPLATPEANFAMNALLERFIDWEDVRGASGAIEVVLQEPGDTLRIPDAVPPEAAVTYVPAGAQVDSAAAVANATRTAQKPGIWNVLVGMRGAIRQVPSLTVITLVPSTELRGGRIGEYRIGQWPRGEGAYAPPRGFVEVTPENMETPVSTHFRLKHFLTKGQEGVWPKYVALSPRLLDKLELTLQELEAAGHPVDNVFVVSGFRTPWYNASGGNTQGRGAMSRHMYGDAADIAIDNDRDGCMDDLNGDGEVDVRDARVIVQAAERVEQKHPELIGGIGIYRPSPGAHCGMVHIDTRGHRARW